MNVVSVTFDTLSYSKRLREAGVPEEQADAHAEVALYLLRAVNPTAKTPVMPEARPEAPAVQIDLAGAIERTTRQVTIRIAAMWAAGVVFIVLFSYVALIR